MHFFYLVTLLMFLSFVTSSAIQTVTVYNEIQNDDGSFSIGNQLSPSGNVISSLLALLLKSEGWIANAEDYETTNNTAINNTIKEEINDFSNHLNVLELKLNALKKFHSSVSNDINILTNLLQFAINNANYFRLLIRSNVLFFKEDIKKKITGLLEKWQLNLANQEFLLGNFTKTFQNL